MNYIPVISGQSLDVVFEGYSLQFTNFVILSSSDSTKTVPFCCFKPNSNKFTQISGTPYYLYDIISSNILSVTLSAIKFLGLYDLIIFNDSGFIKLSDTGYLIDHIISPFVTPTPTITITPTISITPTRTATPTVTPTISITPTRTVTPTISITPTRTVTPTVTQTRTLTPTPTSSVTPTVTVTPTFTTLPSFIVVDGLTLNPDTYPYFSYTVAKPQSIYSNYQDCEFSNPCNFNLFFNPVNQDILGGVGYPAYLSGGRWYYVDGGCSDSGCGITTVISNSGADQAYYVLPVTGWAGNITVAYPTPTPSITPSMYLTPTITPSITPTISITPSITKTPSRTPTITPTISLTPSITPTATTSQLIPPTYVIVTAISGLSANLFNNYYKLSGIYYRDIYLYFETPYSKQSYYFDSTRCPNASALVISYLYPTSDTPYIPQNMHYKFYTSFNNLSNTAHPFFGPICYLRSTSSCDVARKYTTNDMFPPEGRYFFSNVQNNFDIFDSTICLEVSASYEILPSFTPTPTRTPTPTPSVTPNMYTNASRQSINEVNNILKNISNPTKNYTNFSILCTIGLNGYCNDWTNQKREWNPNFWGYPYRDILNFSGVSLNTELNATLITPQHFISNSHFPPSLSCCFFDHNTGEPIHIKIADFRTFGEDNYIGKLETPVPSVSSIKIYKIAASDHNTPLFGSFGSVPAINTFPLIYLGGKAFYNQSCFHGGCVGSNSYDPFNGSIGNRAYINTSSLSLTTISACFVGKDLASTNIVGGESSNPMFILLNNELLLYGTFFYPDFGPWWGGYNTIQSLSSRIIDMGNPNNYTLSAVYLNRI